MVYWVSVLQHGVRIRTWVPNTDIRRTPPLSIE